MNVCTVCICVSSMCVCVCGSRAIVWIERASEDGNRGKREGRVCGCITLIAGRGLSGENIESREGRRVTKRWKGGRRPWPCATKTEARP